MIQYIFFADRVEKTEEAKHVCNLLVKEKIKNLRIGFLERDLFNSPSRSSFVARRPFESNSILIGNLLDSQDDSDFFYEKPEDFLQSAKLKTKLNQGYALKDLIKAGYLINQNQLRKTRYRIFIQLAFCYDKMGHSNPCIKALYAALSATLSLSPNSRSKALGEIFKTTKRINFLLRILTSKKVRQSTPAINLWGFTLSSLSIVLIDRIFNWC